MESLLPVLFAKLATGVALDRLFGEPPRWHPLVGFGRWAAWLEARVRPRLPGRAGGILAWLLAVAPWLAAALWLRDVHPLAHWAVDIGLLYFALGARSLALHAEAIAAPLAAGELEAARVHVGWIVSRDTRTLDATGVAKAGTESVLENGNDAVFGALFWFCVAGGAGALLFRLANTLDAMWGYRTARFIRFGWAAARLDDVLNWLPARLTAVTYAALGHWRDALACWRTQAATWDSPNAGPVMAAGAGALRVQLGGAAVYHGRSEQRPPLGCGRRPDAASLRAAVRLMERGILLWLAAVATAAIAAEWLAHA